MATDSLFNRVALIGIGLIGGSLARALRLNDLATTIVAYDRSPQDLAKARELGIIDTAAESLAAAVGDADIVVLCTPVGSYGDIAAAMAPHLKPGAIVSDVGSTKGSVVHDVGPHIPDGVHFVPGHPVAGTEKSGPAAGFASLFEQRWCILTPPEGTGEAAVKTVTEMWRRIGSDVEIMTAEHHDKVLAITSHVPHLLAYNIVSTVTDLEEHLKMEVFKYAAGGFRDFTRIAASDPVMWRDVFLNNRDAVLEMLGRYIEDLHALQRAIRWGEGDKLEDLFTRTREARQGVVKARQA